MKRIIMALLVVMVSIGAVARDTKAEADFSKQISITGTRQVRVDTNTTSVECHSSTDYSSTGVNTHCAGGEVYQYYTITTATTPGLSYDLLCRSGRSEGMLTGIRHGGVIGGIAGAASRSRGVCTLTPGTYTMRFGPDGNSIDVQNAKKKIVRFDVIAVHCAEDLGFCKKGEKLNIQGLQ